MPQQIINGVGKAGIRTTSSGGSTSIETDAQAFITAAGLTDTTQKNAIIELVKDLKSAGIWTKMTAIYPFVGGTATTHKWNLKDARDLDAAYRLVFNGGWTHSSTGALPNGTTGYANTFLNPSLVMTATTSHSSVYSRTSTFDASAERHFFGANSLRMLTFRYTAYARLGGTTDIPNAVQTNTAGNSSGFFVANRSSSNISLYKNNSAIESGTITGSFDNLNVYLGAWNYNNTVQYPSNKEMAFVSFGTDLNSGELSAYYNIVEKYQYALGRNINAVLPYYYKNTYDFNTNLFIINGAISDATQQSAINTLVNDLKAAGIWTKMKAVYPMVGGTATSHKFNLVNPIDTDAAYRLSFVGGWTHTSNGVQPSASLNGYANTFISPSTRLTLNNVHLSAYARTNSIYDGDMGVLGAHPTYYSIGLTAARFTCYDGLNAYDSPTPNPMPSSSLGFLIGSRTASNNAKLYLNSTTIASNGGNSVGVQPSGNIFLGAWNGIAPGYPNGLFSKTNKQYAFFSIGDGLTDLESNLFYQIVEKYQYTLGRNINTSRPFYYNSSYTNETNAFIFNGAVTDATQISAVNTLVTTLKTAGIWTKMKAVYPMVGGTATSHKFNLVNPIDSTSAYALTFAGGWTHNSTGALPNGTTAYANTFLTPSTALSLNSTHISYYSRTSTTGGSDMGASVANAKISLYIKETTYSAFRINTDGAGTESALSNDDGRGFYIGNRIISNKQTLFKNNTKNDFTVNSLGLPNVNIWLGALNNPIPYYGAKQCAFSSIGDGLTDAEATTFYNAVQAFQTTLGRQV